MHGPKNPSFTFLYSHRSWLERNLDGSQQRSGHYWYEKYLCPPVIRFQTWKRIHKYSILKGKGIWLRKILLFFCFQFTLGHSYTVFLWFILRRFYYLRPYDVSDKFTGELRIGKDVEKRGRGLTHALRRCLPGECEEYHDQFNRDFFKYIFW